MRSPIPDYLANVLSATEDELGGSVADYIPELASAEPNRAAVAIATVDGAVYSAGDDDVSFSIQSMSKPFTYALALADRGIEGVLSAVGVEPSGEAFNEISLEHGTGRPRNPMINAGAIATHALVEGDMGTRVERLRSLYSSLAGQELGIDESVFSSEMETAYRNLGLGHLMRSFGVFEDDPAAVVEGYIRQCAVSVNVRELAMMAATLANSGVQPATGERLLDPAITRQVLSVMATCGMYDAAGDWLSTVGIPAKSGVAGGIIGVLPGQVGVAVFSPRLDAHGNSLRGVRMMERLSRDMGMHLMDAARPSRSAMRDIYTIPLGDGEATVYELQGDLVFSSTESLLRSLSDQSPSTNVVIFDLHRVDEVTDVARRMSIEGAERLVADGHRVVLVDPDRVLPDIEIAPGDVVETYSSIDEVPATR